MNKTKEKKPWTIHLHDTYFFVMNSLNIKCVYNIT